MSAPVSVDRNGHRTWLKWHRARRRASDPAFTGSRILEGMAAGASVEVDLVVTADKGFAVLHDLADASRETTGNGPPAKLTDAEIRSLRLRGNDGAATTEPVMLLEDLCALLVARPPHPDALLQLDYKQDETVLDERAVACFRRATAPVARNMIVSSGSAAAVEMLAAAVPGLRIGYDPSDEATFMAALKSGSLETFVEEAVAAAPGAELIYLHWEMVTAAADAGFDLVGAFHRHGKRIDAWTIRTVDAESVAVVERLLACGVDQITTDDPEALAAALEPHP